MPTKHAYACKDYPGMEACPGHFVAETAEEVMKLMELHAVVAHGEDPAAWSDEDKAYFKSFITSE
ncbi:MAG: DUF1059 domain-containing protein [Kiloniellaceae bacterium]